MLKRFLPCAAWFCLGLAFNALADTTSIKIGVSHNMNAQLMTPDGPGPYPAILLLHTSGGLQAGDTDYAKHLVASGYVVLLPEFLAAYGITAETRQLTFTSDADSIYADFLASIGMLRKMPAVNPGQIAAIGFSNGGYFALWLAASGEVNAGISYYGAVTGAGTDPMMNRFQQLFTPSSSPVLILHGSDDSTVKLLFAERLDKMLGELRAPHEFQAYAGAEHRFERDRTTANDAAAADAWQRSQDFLAKTLK